MVGGAYPYLPLDALIREGGRLAAALFERDHGSIRYRMYYTLSIGTKNKDPRIDQHKLCAVCHSLAPEFHKEGPSLSGFWGRKAGTAPFYGGYQSLKGATFVWNNTTLDAWLADPRGMTGGKDTKMTVRVTDADQRADLIAYLKKVGRN
jgi:cytochrome c2